MEARIVVVNNDAGTRDLFSLGLKIQGWQIFGYTYAQINMTDLDNVRPDLIILDFNPSDGGMGWEFLQLLKMGDSTAKIPVIITMTPFELEAEIKDYLLHRYINVIHAPVNFDQLLPLIQKTLTDASRSHDIFSGDSSLPILLVDDKEDLRDNFATVLRLEGYRVVTAYNGQVALDNVSRADFSLILLDIDMPIMNGYQFLTAYDRQLRSHAPVIIISGEDDIESQNLPGFVVKVFSKPVHFKDFLQQVKKYAQSVPE